MTSFCLFGIGLTINHANLFFSLAITSCEEITECLRLSSFTAVRNLFFDKLSFFSPRDLNHFGRRQSLMLIQDRSSGKKTRAISLMSPFQSPHFIRPVVISGPLVQGTRGSWEGHRDCATSINITTEI